MNKEIEKFVKQAGTIMVQDGCYEPMPVLDKEKFVQLIIQKCAEIAEDCYSYHIPLSSVPDTIRKFERIKD